MRDIDRERDRKQDETKLELTVIVIETKLERDTDKYRRCENGDEVEIKAKKNK